MSLADIGRARPFSTLGGSFAEGARDLLKTRMAMEQTATEQKSRDIADRLNTLKVQEAEQAVAYKKEPYNVKLSPLLTVYEPGTPEYDKLYKSLAAAAGANEMGNTTKGDYERGIHGLATETPVLKEIMSVKLSQLQEQYGTVAEQVNEAKLAGDEEKVGKLVAKQQALAQRIIAGSGKLGDYLSAIGKKEQEGFTLGPGQIRYDAAGNPVATGGEKEPPTNDFTVFYRGYKADHPNASESEISRAWHKMKVAEAKTVGEFRIPSYTQAQPGIPVGYVFNRRKGEFEWKGQGPKPPMDPQAAASYKSDVKSLENLTKQADMTEQAIKQADKNAEALNDASAKFARSNYPGPNRIVTWVGTQAGSPQTQAEIGRFKVALLAFSREYMRVVTGAARSVTELSIKAQGTADDVLSKFDSWSALNAKVQQARIEMANTSKSYREQVGEIKGRIGGVGGGGPAPTPNASDPYGIR